jgi:hypothetical protein
MRRKIETLRSLFFDCSSHDQEWIGTALGLGLPPKQVNLESEKIGALLQKLPPPPRARQIAANAKTNGLCDVLKEEIAVRDAKVTAVSSMLTQLAQMNDLAEKRLIGADKMVEALLEKNDEV